MQQEQHKIDMALTGWNAMHRFRADRGRERKNKVIRSLSHTHDRTKCSVNDFCRNIFILSLANGTKCVFAHFPRSSLSIDFLSFRFVHSMTNGIVHFALALFHSHTRPFARSPVRSFARLAITFHSGFQRAHFSLSATYFHIGISSCSRFCRSCCYCCCVATGIRCAIIITFKQCTFFLRISNAIEKNSILQFIVRKIMLPAEMKCLHYI